MKMESRLTDNLNRIIAGIVNVEKNDINNENANMSSMTPAGQMMRFASEVSKIYTLENLVSERFKKAHNEGEIHIHDLDYYPSKTTTCLQYDLADMFEKGFQTKHGFIREAKSITTYATLATIIFQTNQNEQHGGQSIPAFDFYMAKGVLKSFRRHFRYRILSFLSLDYVDETNSKVKEFINENIYTILPGKEVAKKTSEYFNIPQEQIERLLEIAYDDTRLETYQAMEGFLHNLNTMHSRGGNQVVFSSINYGTDTSEEGRMVIRELLKATEDGLGKRETPIFPIQIFKVKEGLNYSDEDYDCVMEDFDGIMEEILKDDDGRRGRDKFTVPNFDLLLMACRTTSRRLFPNFLFLDAKFNRHEKWEMSDPQKYRYEVATMGCRTRVFENLHGEKSSLGRGNLSFTSINFPRIAIEVRRNVEKTIGEMKSVGKFFNEQEEIDTKYKLLVEQFHERVKEMTYLIAEQLIERFTFQKTALAKQFPFMRSNDLWKGMGRKDPNDELDEALLSGTLGIGFVGGANAMYALFDKDHGNCDISYTTLYNTLKIMNEVVEDLKKQHGLNFSIISTPAESLAGRFLRIDREKFGEIENVTNRDYYVNSFHIDVKEKIGIFEKIRKEAPFHELTKGGHITYVELDGEARKNTSVILKIVKVMKEEGIGYGSINHPVDKCRECGTETIIGDNCPVCGSDNISRIRRITGYLTGDLDSWNSAKKSEEKDRVKHTL